MGWLLVTLAAASEIIGVMGLKMFSQNKTLQNMLIFVGGFGVAFGLLYASFNFLQLSIAYAVWLGTGTAGAVLVNMLFFGESKNMGRIISLVIIVVGVTGLKAVS
ncbi:paired small multidrug resistance pump [Geomicrobium halophilum]|uniref:Paired small multidrug resistance pump n=1 Tax=Geomicrobium halophilum TaxID=549000 RepID=A0A841PWL9_9BACL|nr:SMR family transporter [Geomicrobium halophilum]MBB6448733.1 paired small multidrug resistance pump [Geomicrobium halophilum]